MKICLKRRFQIGKGKFLEKHQEGFVLGTHWDENGKFEYYVDFGKEGEYTVGSEDCDVLNCR